MRRVTIILVIVFSLLIPVITISCDAPQEPEAEAWAVIGPEGGVVEVTDPESSIYGTRIEIPPGALTEETTISVNETTFDLFVSDKCELTSVSRAILIEPDNTVLSKNCTITLPYSDADDDGFIDGTNLSEEFLSVFFALSHSEEAYLANDYVIDTDANVIHISTNHFSKWKWWGQRWNPGVTVNYYIDSVPDNGDDESLFHQEIADAFLMWQTALDDLFTFSKTENLDEADIVFRKKNFCEWFDGLDCDAAGSTAPGYSIRGEFTIYFNTHIDNLPRRWIANDYCDFDYSGPPFLRVAVHEIGHAIGLNDIRDTVNVGYEHTACNPTCDIDNRVIMRYDAGPLKPFICLSCLDISEVRDHYGLSAQQDTDDDNISNLCDNCPDIYNPDQADSDGDGIGDACSEVYHAGIDVEKTADPSYGVASTDITFTITIANTSDLTLDPVEVVDTLPDGMSYVSDDAGGTESPEGTITWDIGPIPSGSAATIHLVARIDGDVLGTATNIVTATGTPPYGDDVEDTDTAAVVVGDVVVDARISISPPEDINVVGDPHYFTATVETSTDGTTWIPYVGATVTFEVTTGPGTLDPVTDVTDTSGEATTTLSSVVSGTSLVKASTTVYSYDLSTDGTGYNSDPAEKDWVDA